MSDEQSELSRRAAELRKTFDLSFATPPRVELDPLQSFLRVTIGGDPHAVRLSDVSAIHVDRRTTPVPTLVSELMGVMASRTTLVPVYDLGALMGYPRIEEARWILTIAHGEPVALAVQQFEGHLRVAGRFLTHELAETDGGALPIVDIAKIIQTIERRARLASEQKET